MVPALEKIISESENMVFFGGAGVSTESGIPDFRSVDGLYHQKYDYPPETILSHTFWERCPEEFYRFYRDKLIVKGAKPNAAHLRLAKLEREGKLKAVVTQNIDGLHQAAGSKTVYELHGSTLRNYCTECGKFFDADFIANSTGVPRCPDCGGIVKPDVVLYEEGLDEQVVSGAVQAIRKADTLIVGGTSLVVYPAAGLLRYHPRRRRGRPVHRKAHRAGAQRRCEVGGRGMKAVILESYVMEEGDLDWSGVKALIPDTTSYVRTAYEEIAPRIGGAEVVFLNKCRMDEAILTQCPNLKFVGIIATGTDNLDLEACRRHGVAVANVPGYSTYSVAQMTFSLLLAICQCAERYNRAVKDGCWQLDIPASYGLLPQVELFGKTFGVYGYGSIGRQTARIAKAFGMRVLVCTRTVRPEFSADGVEFVEFDTLLRESDVLSLHCPATPKTRGLISADALARMKPGAILLNTARGALVDEEAVAAALRSGLLGFYGADAFGTEPLPQESPLRKEPHAILTPHIAWTTKEALQNLMDITTRNLRTFLDGNGENIVNR